MSRSGGAVALSQRHAPPTTTRPLTSLINCTGTLNFSRRLDPQVQRVRTTLGPKVAPTGPCFASLSFPLSSSPYFPPLFSISRGGSSRERFFSKDFGNRIIGGGGKIEEKFSVFKGKMNGVFLRGGSSRERFFPKILEIELSGRRGRRRNFEEKFSFFFSLF